MAISCVSQIQLTEAGLGATASRTIGTSGGNTLIAEFSKEKWI